MHFGVTVWKEINKLYLNLALIFFILSQTTFLSNASMTPKNIFSSNSKDHDDKSFHVEEKEGVTAVVYGSKNLQRKKW